MFVVFVNLIGIGIGAESLRRLAVGFDITVTIAVIITIINHQKPKTTNNNNNNNATTTTITNITFNSSNVRIIIVNREETDLGMSQEMAVRNILYLATFLCNFCLHLSTYF